MVNEVNSNSLSLQQSSISAAATVQQQVRQSSKVDKVAEFARQSSAASGNNVPPNQANADDSSLSLEAAMSQIQEHVRRIARDLDFRVDEDSGRTVVTVTDPETSEVVRQIPSEEVMNIARALAKGGGLLMELQA